MDEDAAHSGTGDEDGSCGRRRLDEQARTLERLHLSNLLGSRLDVEQEQIPLSALTLFV
jgi:hypothetical protein